MPQPVVEAARATPTDWLGVAGIKRGGVCPYYTGQSRGDPKPHIWTSVQDMAIEFYPCACGKRP